MRLTQKALHNFVPISGLIIALVTLFITIIWAFAKEGNLSGVAGCASFACLLMFGVRVLLGLFFGSWLIIFLITLTADLVSKGIKTKNKNLHNRRESAKKMTLTANPLKVNTGIVDLRIHNNESSFVVLREVVVFDEHARYRVSVEPDVRVEAHKSRTTRFLSEDNTSKSLQYYIRGHLSDGTSNKALYGQGIRVFEIAVTYDSDEKRNSGIIKRFRVTVNYKAEHDFDLKIQDAD